MGKRILIVDDINFIVEFESKVIDALSKEINQKIIIDSAHSVSSALEMIEKHHYDAMVVDMNLPDGTGIDIAKAAQAKSKETRIAALTIYPQSYEQDYTYFDAFFKKPILPATYKENIRRLLQV